MVPGRDWENASKPATRLNGIIGALYPRLVRLHFRKKLRVPRNYRKTNGSTARNREPAIKHDHSKEPNRRNGRPPRKSNSLRRMGIRKSIGAIPSGNFLSTMLMTE